MLLNLAQWLCECECLRVALVKARSWNVSYKAWQYCGFERMGVHSKMVDKCIVEVQKIRETVEDSAQTQDKAWMMMYGTVNSVQLWLIQSYIWTLLTWGFLLSCRFGFATWGFPFTLVWIWGESKWPSGEIATMYYHNSIYSIECGLKKHALGLIR